ncbi:uncharacterized protein LOC108741526 [Agrilus planipennis]|uniref:Uncharacterized protein LOC108741526 n=1 Tax=Agrilus planipennis TaxID=224129 RepID=A0A1W4X738_AGRPL|nr:uncharacterized protein LOC108741526 [Agrilus planipennis]
MSLQIQRELEMKLHQQLYNNIYLLTLTYPPSDALKSVFKKDMFLKNNKTAFHHVIHYLLSILDPIKIKEKVSAWPIFEVKMESQFRNEIMKYLNEISLTYEDSNIPQIMPSHLISPGGFKFVKFMLRVSEFVLLEHLKRDPTINESLILSIRPSKDAAVTRERIQNLNTLTLKINQNTQGKMDEFEKVVQLAKEEASKIIFKVKEIDVAISELKKKCNTIKEEIKTDLPSFTIESGFNDEINIIKEKLDKILEVHNQFKNCMHLAHYLNNENNILEYNKEKFTIPTETCKFLSKPDILVFKDLVDAFTDHINQLRLKFKPLNEHQLKESYSNCSYLLEKTISTSSDLKELYTKLVSLSDHANDVLPLEEVREPFRQLKFSQVNEEQEDTTVSGDSLLAIPLEISSENKENIYI